MCVPAQPQTIITNRISTTGPNIVAHHDVEEKVVKATACDEYFFANLNVSIHQSVVEYPPALLQNSECAFNILAAD
jgi:hypothetical protein